MKNIITIFALLITTSVFAQTAKVEIVKDQFTGETTLKTDMDRVAGAMDYMLDMQLVWDQQKGIMFFLAQIHGNSAARPKPLCFDKMSQIQFKLKNSEIVTLYVWSDLFCGDSGTILAPEKQEDLDKFLNTEIQAVRLNSLDGWVDIQPWSKKQRFRIASQVTAMKQMIANL